MSLYLKEQIELAVKYGADYIVGETFCNVGEARLALECIKKYGAGTLSISWKSDLILDVEENAFIDLMTDGL